MSPSAAYIDKYKLSNKQAAMKTSFAGAAVSDKKENEKETHLSPTTLEIKKDKDKDKEREYLNVFEDEDL